MSVQMYNVMVPPDANIPLPQYPRQAPPVYLKKNHHIAQQIQECWDTIQEGSSLKDIGNVSN